jgi:hypothetical protein
VLVCQAYTDGNAANQEGGCDLMMTGSASAGRYRVITPRAKRVWNVDAACGHINKAVTLPSSLDHV